MTPQEFFKNDRFADNVGIELTEVKKGYSRAQLKITDEHLNAGGRTQGGVLFTLADLALAAAPIRMVHWLFRFPLISISYVPVLQETFFMPRLVNAIPAVVQDVIR